MPMSNRFMKRQHNCIYLHQADVGRKHILFLYHGDTLFPESALTASYQHGSQPPALRGFPAGYGLHSPDPEAGLSLIHI